MTMAETEECGNPWKKKCNNTDIDVYIYYRDGKIPICRECWTKIAKSDREWGKTI